MTIYDNSNNNTMIQQQESNHINNTKISILGYETPFTVAVVIVVLSSMFLGALKYLYETIILKDLKPRISHLIIYSFISSFAGYLSFNLLLYYGVETDSKALGPLTGLGAWAGVALIQAFEKALSNGLTERLRQAMLLIISDKKDNTTFPVVAEEPVAEPIAQKLIEDKSEEKTEENHENIDNK